MRLKKIPTKVNRQKGFTMIELLLSTVIFLVAIAAIYGVSRLALVQRNTVNTRVDQLRSARIALEYIRKDAINAGYGFHKTGANVPDNIGNSLFAISADSDTTRDLLTSIMAGNNISTNTLNTATNMDTIAFASRDPKFNGGKLLNYTSSVANGTAVDVTTDVCDTTLVAPLIPCDVNPYDLFLLESSTLGTTQGVMMATSKPTTTSITFAINPTDPLSINQSATGSGQGQSILVTTPGGGTMKRVFLTSYSITSTGVLVRKMFGNQKGAGVSGQIETRELCYGVSDFQIKYFMEDGTLVDDPSNSNNGRLNQQLMNNVVQIQISVTLGADQGDGQPKVSTPITIREYISTKNLRYEAS